MIQIVPTLLDTNPEEYKEHLAQITQSSAFQEGWIHIDFADNQFVPNETVGVDVVEQNSTNLKKEAHLMVSHPMEWIDSLKAADFKRVIFHYESEDDVSECIEKIKQSGMEVGVALKMETPIEKLEPFESKIDLVLIMCITPGFQGQPFIPESLEKIKALKEKGWNVRISVDGSVKDTNAKELMEAGADQLSIGSFLLKGDTDENIEKIWEKVNS